MSDSQPTNHTGSSGILNRVSISRVRRETLTTNLLVLLGLSLIAVLAALPLEAGPLEPVDHPQEDSMRAVHEAEHEAEHEVDHAWEVYHRAALGGTVASPNVQAQIEEHLHQARTLITQAQEAAEHGDKGQVEHLTTQVRVHTTQAIDGSKEPKK